MSRRNRGPFSPHLQWARMTPSPHAHANRHTVHHIHRVVEHHAATSTSWASIGDGLFGLVVLAGLIWLLVRSANASAERARQTRAEALTHLSEVMSAPLKPIVVPELGLTSAEVAYYATEATVLGTHTRTRRVGYSGGPSFRVARGVYWHASSFSSTPIRESFTAVDDTGRLIVTNERIIFVGARNSFSWPLAKILSIERFSDGLQINPVNKRPVVFTTGSQDAAIIIDRARAGALTKTLGSTST
jgi:hypothetical protein